MLRKLGFLLMVGILVGAAVGLFAFASAGDPDYTSAEPISISSESGRETVMEEAESTSEPANVQSVAAPVIDAPAPGFILRDLAGNAVSLEDYRGSVVLLNFWATWCTTCSAEMPTFEAGYANHQDDDFVILAVNYDEPEGMVAEFVEEMGLTFPVLLDPGAKTVVEYRVRGFPTSFIIDRDGVIRHIHIGLMTEEYLQFYLEDAGLDL